MTATVTFSWSDGQECTYFDVDDDLIEEIRELYLDPDYKWSDRI